MTAVRTSLNALQARCVRGTNHTLYHNNFFHKVESLVKSSTYTPDRLFDPVNGRETIAEINAYPNHANLRVKGLRLGKAGDTSGFIRRITAGDKEYLQTQEGAPAVEISTGAAPRNDRRKDT